MRLIFDTETAGLPIKGAPPGDPRQPHLVQLAALLTEDDGTERAAINLIIRPQGWTIPAEVAAIHGITTEIAERCGVTLNLAMLTFESLYRRADTLVAHNIGFDWLILLTARKRAGWPPMRREDALPQFCTMAASTPHCRLPPTERMVAAGMSGFKAPKLIEAYRHFFGEDFQGQHDASADVRACARVYLHLQQIKERAAA